MLEFDDFVLSGEKVFEITVAVNVFFGIWATVGAAYWLYHLTPPKQ